MISCKLSVNPHRSTLYPGPCHFVVVSALQHKKVQLPQAFGLEEFATAGPDILRLSYGKNHVFFYKCEFPNRTWETNETITECLDQPTVLVCFRPLNLSSRQSQKISDNVGLFV